MKRSIAINTRENTLKNNALHSCHIMGKNCPAGVFLLANQNDSRIVNVLQSFGELWLFCRSPKRKMF